MKIPSILSLCFLLGSCSSILPSGKPAEGKRLYSYVDVSGRYPYTREVKTLKSRLITRTQIASNQGSESKLLEKSVMVSQIGSIKTKRGRSLSVRPFGSEFTVWLDGKNYESRMKIDPRTKSMALDLKSPEEKWTGRSSVAFPRGKIFCYFSQIPECLYHANLLIKAQKAKGEAFPFYVIWDGFPFVQEQLSGVGTKLFSSAMVKYEKTSKNVLRYLVEVDGQTVLYQFSKAYDLVRMFWVAQGISIIPPGEEMSDVEE